MCSRVYVNLLFIFQPLSRRREVTVAGLVYCLLAGEGHGNLLVYCSQFCGNQTHCWSHRLHSWYPAGRLRFINPCDFKTLDRFKCSWLAAAPAIWNRFSADMILRGEAYGWHTILQEVQRCICN